MEKNNLNQPSVSNAQTIVRFARHSDLSRIAYIARVTWDATYNETIAPENRRVFLERAYKPENLESGIDAPGHWFYVAELNAELVGFGHFLKRYHPNQKRAELVRLYVLPAYQNLNIGHTIMETGFAALAQAGIQQCSVSVQETNEKARKFYERHNFVLHRRHGQFLGTQIITLVEYARPIGKDDIKV